MTSAEPVIPVVALGDGVSRIAGRPYTPIDLSRVNDQVVRLALIKGEYHWHHHEKEDELFYVITGRITIQMNSPYADITLTEGEMAVIPQGVEHCPLSDEESYVLMFEPASLQSAGERSDGPNGSSLDALLPQKAGSYSRPPFYFGNGDDCRIKIGCPF